jgi:Fe-S-cluster containining protein
MIRNCSLEDISDGRLYSENDMVKTDTGSCAGCKADCCHKMGNSIVLDPYDVFHLTKQLGCTFEQLLVDKAELNVMDGIILPNLKMTGDTNQCAFLDESHRCSIHQSRPGICRLFPLGRYWEADDSFRYILQTGQCTKSGLSKIKVKKWLDIGELSAYNEFVCKWHNYIKKAEAAVAEESSAKQICMDLLKLFYFMPYDGNKDFYEQFEQRVLTALSKLDVKY